MTGLRRFATREHLPPAQPPAKRCELCGAALASAHGHVVDLERRSLSCACRPCYLLFTAQGSGGTRFRAVPERWLYDPTRRLSDADWDELRIPVATAFFFVNSALDRVIALYPSPGGATECELNLAAWQRIAAEHPLLRTLSPDVEAIFVHRTGVGLAVFLIPVDACYALVGEVRLRWRGLDGGDDVRTALAAFVEQARSRGVPLAEED